MTDCEKYIDMLSAMADGELTDAEQEQLMAHIERCPSCGALLDLYREASAAISEAMAPPPPELCKNVMAAVSARKSRPHTVRMITKYLAAAACVAIILFVAPRLDGLGCGSSMKNEAPAAGAPESAERYTAGGTENAPMESSAAKQNELGTPHESCAPMASSAPAETLDDANAEEPFDTSMSMNAELGVFAGDYYAVITVYGEKPNVLSDAVFKTVDGLTSAEVTTDTADKLIALGYDAEYGDASKAAALVIYTE